MVIKMLIVDVTVFPRKRYESHGGVWGEITVVLDFLAYNR